jgi:hypothetical protein
MNSRRLMSNMRLPSSRARIARSSGERCALDLPRTQGITEGTASPWGSGHLDGLAHVQGEAIGGDRLAMAPLGPGAALDRDQGPRQSPWSSSPVAMTDARHELGGVSGCARALRSRLPPEVLEPVRPPGVSSSSTRCGNPAHSSLTSPLRRLMRTVQAIGGGVGS